MSIKSEYIQKILTAFLAVFVRYDRANFSYPEIMWLLSAMIVPKAMNT